MQQRRFHRVTFSAPSDLTHQEMTYQGRVENVSLKGALISADECIMIPLGERCQLSIFAREGEPPIVLTAQVVHSFFSMIGVRFVSFAEGDENRMFELMERITSEPETLRDEWEGILAQRKAGKGSPAYPAP
jgi:hypothetical protein